MTFLTAEWRKLAMFNYVVSPDVLHPYVPEGVELDLWEGKCYVSVVGFMFRNTKLLGIPIPFHTHFEEVNLRFYVKRKEGDQWKRGVVFIKEIVPKSAITWVANTIYKEHYKTLPMRHQWEQSGGKLQIDYRWKNQNWNTISLSASDESKPMVAGSLEEFIAEHYWGYSQLQSGTSEYEVQHEPWEVYPVKSYEINVDFEATYGRRFGFLRGRRPENVLLAEGSPIKVLGKKVLDGAS